jgi:hypothetical protein
MRHNASAIRTSSFQAWLCVLTILFAGSAFSQVRPMADLNARLNVSDHEVQQIAVVADEPSQVKFAVSLDGRAVTVHANAHSLRARDYKLLARGKDGTLTPMTPAAIRTFRGTIPEIGGEAAISIANGQVTGMLTDGQSTWWVQGMRSIDPSANPLDHIVFRNDDLAAGDWSCGLDAMMPGIVHDHGGIAGPTPPPPGCLKKAEIAFDADFEYFQFFNIDGAIDPVADTEADIASVMNVVDFIYRRDCGITYEMTTTIVQIVEPDPYTSTNSSTLLNEFAAYWRVNHSEIVRDVAHLMTGKDVDGNIIGVAWLPGVCVPDTDNPNQQKPYGLSQSQFTPNMAWRVRLTAHELGHNWSAPHCNQGNNPPCLETCNIMCSSVSGCVQSFEEFESCSREFITTYRDSLSCLDDAGGVSFTTERFVGTGVLAGDRFGTSVAMDGDIAIVGAYTDDGTATDVGSAYILRFDPLTSTWQQEAKLTASDPNQNDRFGSSVDILDSESGEVAIIGALLDDGSGRDSGAAYIFRHTGAGWVQEQKLLPADGDPFDFFGKSVAITSSNGTEVAAISAYLDDDGGASSGSVYVFRNTGAWVEDDKLVANDPMNADQFGVSVDIAAANGEEYLIVGAYQDDSEFVTNIGSAYVFQKNGAKWIQTDKILSPHPVQEDQFGISVGITASANNQTAAVAAWKADPTGITNAGEVYVYQRAGSEWNFQDDLRASDLQAEAHFGNAISLRGDALLIAAYIDDNPTLDAGSAYLFKRVGGGWTQETKFTATAPLTNEQFGFSVGLGSGDQLIIGAWGDDGNGLEAGAVYITSGSVFVDCNKNQSPDDCDIASGTSFDLNTDGIPDECQKPPPSCPGDIVPFPGGNGVVDVDDLLRVINDWGQCPMPPFACPADLAPPGGNSIVDVDDLLVVINNWGLCPQ